MDIQSLFINVFKCIREKIKFHEDFISLLNMKDSEGNTAIHFATFRGNYSIVTELINSGVDLNARNKMGLSVMHMAAQGDRPNLIVYFKEKYNLDIIDKDFSGNTPLHWACYTCAENVITFLLRWMNDVNIKDNKGQTPLHIAIYTFRPKIIKKLLSKGADINLTDDLNQSVLSIVTMNKNNIPDMENVLKVITDNKPVRFKSCFSNSGDNENKSIFDSRFFAIIHLICETCVFYLIFRYTFQLINFIIFGIILLCLIVGFLMAHLIDPGYVQCEDDRTWLEIIESTHDINDYCPYCKIQKIGRIKHCHSCGRCVEEFDHHCNWIDNCVGKNNANIFLFFVIIVLINLVYSFVISFIVFMMNNNLSVIKQNPNLEYFGISFILRYSSKDLLSFFIMCICLFFFIPVLFVLLNQIKVRMKRKSEAELIDQYEEFGSVRN